MAASRSSTTIPTYRGYYLGAGEDGQDADRLLHDALTRAERVGLGRWVFHNREYLVAIRPLGDVVALHTMRFADELIDSDGLDVASLTRKPTKREVEMAATLVDSLHERFDPEQFEDSYRERVLALIDAKARGEEPDLPEPPEPAGEMDLMAALEASLCSSARTKSSGSPSRRSSSRAKRPEPKRRPPRRSRR